MTRTRTHVSVTNLTHRRVIDPSFVEEAVRQTLLSEGKGLDVFLSVVLVGVKKIRSLNLKYNLQNAPTDVLSFSQNQAMPSNKGDDKFIGEIFLCPEIIKKNALRLKVVFKKELAHATIHGVLHLLGHEHEKDKNAYLTMHSIEEKIMDRLEIKI